MSFSRAIPKIIHAIWAGGTKIMPLDGIKNTTRWALSNSEFDIWVWVDYKTSDPDMLNDYINQYREEVKRQKKPTQSEINSFKPINLESVVSRIKFKDISEENLRDEDVAYEIDKLRPNYGSSSDILRYKILHKYGGVYIDCTDVYPNLLYPLLNSNFFSTDRQTHLLCVDHLSQESKFKTLPPFNLKRIQAKKVGNDTFICSPQNPLMKKIIEKVRNNYDKNNDDLDTRIRHAHDSRNIKEETIERTGPQVINEIFDEYLHENSHGLSAKFHDGEEKFHVEIKAVRTSEGQLTIPRDNNTQNWLNPEVVFPESEERFLNTLKNTIFFEAKHFKILRLDDHIEDYHQFLGESKQDNVNTAEEITRLVDIIKTATLHESDLYVQATGKFQVSIDLCKEKNWLSFFDLNEKKRLTAARYQSNLVLIREIVGARTDEVKESLLNTLLTKLSDPEEPDKASLQTDIKAIQANMSFNLEDYRKIADKYNANDPKNEALIKLSDLELKVKNELLKLMKEGLAFLEYFVQSPRTTFTTFESVRNLVKDCIYFGEILNESFSQIVENLTASEKSTILVPIEKALNLLNILNLKENEYRQGTSSVQEGNRQRRGPSCCNIS